MAVSTGVRGKTQDPRPTRTGEMGDLTLGPRGQGQEDLEGKRQVVNSDLGCLVVLFSEQTESISKIAHDLQAICDRWHDDIFKARSNADRRRRWLEP